jgi:hypothetical protein
MKKKTTQEIENKVQKILSMSKESIRKELIKYIERINYLEGEEFYNFIKSQ